MNLLFVVVVASLLVQNVYCASYNINPVLGLPFDGVGGLSGGGATSRLLVDYQDPYRSQILDYLFLPSFGASLHILKVEIGGDAQSTEGTEPSHMHMKGDENYNRGYEWWLMKEAKSRNPNLKLYGLSWGFPSWLGEGGKDPLTNSTISYILNWLNAAQKIHNLTIDYIGIWNEKSYSKAYIMGLKSAIVSAGLKTKLIAADDCCGPWGICDDLNKDSEWAMSVDIVGGHYPNMATPESCNTLLANSKIPLWASEDFSSYFKSGACWTRLLNRNYILGNLTSTISWNLIAAYYDQLPYSGDGLMHAPEPWSGFYEVDQVIWATAHFTQFSFPGWNYLKVGQGSGVLQNGGTYASLYDGNKGFTVILESMTHDESACVHEAAPSGNITAESVTLKFNGVLSSFPGFYVFSSSFTAKSADANWFVYEGFLTLENGSITIELQPNMIYTLSTINGTKGSYGAAPKSTPFPFPYSDNFDSYSLSSEAFGFTDQAGSFEIVQSSDKNRGMVMRQMAPAEPITWCGGGDPLPFSLIGDHSWNSISVSIDVYIETEGSAFLATAVTSGGCMSQSGSDAIVFAISTQGTFQLSTNTGLKNILYNGTAKISPQTWYTLTINVGSDETQLLLNEILLYNTSKVTSKSSGWVAIGSSWDYVQYDRLSIGSSSKLTKN